MAFLRSMSSGLKLNLHGKAFSPLYQARTVVLKPVAVAKPTATDGHDERNMKLGRPMSPHITIYRFPVPAMMSISHRATGIILTAYIWAFAGSSFLSTDIPHMVTALQGLHLPGALTFTAKFLLSIPFSYHFYNGLRHLIWDTGKGLTLKEVYLTGYITLGSTALTSLWLASL